jgi:putative heme-binding domain-containing protein
MRVKLLKCAGALMTTVSLFVVQPAAVSPPQEPAGDRTSGKALFESSGCLNCHRIGERGSRVGPDLSDVGDRRSTDELRRALLTPDEQVLPEHRSVRIVTKDGTKVVGRLLN